MENDDFLKTLKLRIKEVRIKHGYSTKDMANLMGVAVNTYRKYESSAKHIGYLTMLKFLEIFGLEDFRYITAV